MLSYFPQVRDEESTYSIFSRLQFALQPPNDKIMGEMLFNKPSEVGRLNFQGSFDYLCSNLPSKFIPEIFFYNNTIFPLFMPFLSTEKQEKTLEYFKGNYPNRVNRYLATSNVNRGRTYIRVCKECIKEDFNIYGDPYYRRQHEIELNRICYKHKIPLYEYTISNYMFPRRYDDYYTVFSNSKEVAIPKKFREKFLDITTDINTIFTSNLDSWNIEITKNKISNKIAEKGYAKVNGVTLHQKFSQYFKEYYTDEFLDYIGCELDLNEYDNWIKHTTSRKKPVGDPLKFILVIRFLFGSFQEFYKYNKEYSPFKEEPYPCLNIVCPNYNKLVIRNIMEINEYHGYPLATFKCEYCGFKYSRRGPDKNDNDIYNKTYVKDYGSLWHDKLKKCVDKEFGIRKMSTILGCNILEIVNIKAVKNKNLNLTNAPKIELANEPDTLLLEQYKNEALSFIKENPTATRLAMYRFNQKAYKYLSENDNEWLLHIIRFPKKNKPVSKEERLKNHWLRKDVLILGYLLNAINKIKAEKTPYERLTIAVLQNYIGYFYLHQNRSKLPKCSQLLDKVCESISSYQKRRVDYAIKLMEVNDANITFGRVLRKANIHRIITVDQEVLNYIEERLKEHSQG